MITLKEQKPDQIIDVAPFPKESEAYPEGARIKATFFWPERAEEPYSFCVPNRLYMFKISRDVYPEQFWVEIFAYQLGCLMGIPVPPAFVAFDSKENKAGSLIEWFYNEKEDLYIRGGDIMQSIINDYDIKKGQKHNFTSILDFLPRLGEGKEYWVKQWAKIIIFDALIGNTDRHQGNWGVVSERGRQHEQSSGIFKNPLVRMSPPFDNGTSMAHEIYEVNFHKFDIKSYVNRGKPHFKWSLEQERKKRDNFKNFVNKMIESYPYTKEIINQCLRFDKEKVKEIFERLTCFKIEPGLSETRAKFMLDLLLYRQEQLLSVLRSKL